MHVVIDGLEYVRRFPSRMGVGYQAATLGAYLKAQRKHCGWTLEFAAEAIGTSKSYLWELEHDKSMPSLALAAKMSRVYGVGLDSLGNFTSNPETRG